MQCRSAECTHEADRVVYWPGSTGPMCGRCAYRAAKVAEVMGFELVVGKLEDWPEYQKAAKEAAVRLGAWTWDCCKGDMSDGMVQHSADCPRNR